MPREFAALYGELGELLDASSAAVESRWDGTANEDRVQDLLGPTTLAGNRFAEQEISTADVDYSGYDLEEFRVDLRAYAERIINEIGPDFLTVLNEPGTMIHIAPGLSDLGRPAAYREVLDYVTGGLDRRGVLIGAGAGTWEVTDYIRQAAASAIDYVDLHIYPLQHGTCDRAFDCLEVATAAGKRVIIGETWLYKVGDRELGRAGAVSVEVFGRDTFSFWSPLDTKYVEMMSRLARYNDVELISSYWGSKYFFAYLEYSQDGSASPGTLIRRSSEEAAENMVAHRLTATGEAFQDIIK